MYFFASMLWIYNIYKFMMLFLERNNVHKKKEALSYIGYFIVNFTVFSMFNVPIIFIITNIIGYTVISLNYKATWKKRILAVLFLFLIPTCIELIFLQIMYGLKLQLFIKDQHEFNYLFTMIQLVIYMMTLILGKFKNIKQGEKVPGSYWFFITFIPITSLYLILLLISINQISVFYMNIGVIALVIVNVLTFYLYDRIAVVYIERTEKLLLQQQNKYYNEQFEIMNASIKATRAIKHDLNNHIAIVYSLVEQENIGEALQYLKDIKGSYSENGNYVQTGNFAIDSVLNFKLQEAYRQNVQVSINLSVPEKIDIPSFEIVTILGNLLDNALEATCKLEQDRTIDIKMKYDKGRIWVKIRNTYNGQLIKQKSKILTTKKKRDNHGIGLENVKSIVQKYEGIMDIEHTDEFFLVTILLYID